MKKNLLWAAACLTVPWQVFAMPSSAREATTQQIASARKIVDDAIQQMTVLNKARLDHPARNHYSLKPGTVVNKRRGRRTLRHRSSTSRPRLLLPLLFWLKSRQPDSRTQLCLCLCL